MANIVKLTAENADELLNTSAYGTAAVIQLQSSTAEAGAFADVGTVALTAGAAIYTVYDVNGTSSTWYRSRYENSGETVVSAWSDPFQVSADGSGLLASLYDAKQRLEIPYTDTAQDENILEWLSQVSAYIHSVTGRKFTPDTSTIYTFDGHSAVRGGRILPIPNGIRSCSLLEVAINTGAAFSTIASGDYFLRPLAQERTQGWPATRIEMTDIQSGGNTAYFYPGYANVRVTGTFGWLAVPSDIQGIALTLLVSAARERSSGGGDSVTVGLGGERTFERSLSYRDRETLNRYRSAPWVS